MPVPKPGKLPLISIISSTFYRSHPASSSYLHNSPLFPNLTFTLNPQSRWALLSEFSSSKVAFLDILQGRYICDPPNGRTFPHYTETKRSLTSGIRLATFGGNSSGSTGGGGLLGGSTSSGGYISARYESLRQENDVTLSQWLSRGTALNPGEEELSHRDSGLLADVAGMLRLEKLLEQPIMTLSNGQARRAVLAGVLLKRPELVLLDEVFMGLDPPSTSLLSHLLEKLSIPPAPTNLGGSKSPLSITPLLALHPQEPLPKWIDNIIYLSRNNGVLALGPKDKAVSDLRSKHGITLNPSEVGEFKEGLFRKVWGGIDAYGKGEDSLSSTPTTLSITEAGNETVPRLEGKPRELLVSMSKISVSYGGKTRSILKDFSWRIHRGDRWGVFGPNGSGKTTLLSLLTSDHPQAYSQPNLYLFSSQPRSHPGTSIFDIQKRIGISSPEIHAFFPTYVGIKRAVSSAFGETFLSNPVLTSTQSQQVETVFAQFRDLLPLPLQAGPGPADYNTIKFDTLSLSQQRLILFMRAIVKQPDLLILDEGFSGMDDVVRTRCMNYLDSGSSGGGQGKEEGREVSSLGGFGESQALVVVAHREEEVPRCVRSWVRLGSEGGKAVFGDV